MAIVAIMILGAIALNNGMDGAIFGLCIAALAGLGGYQVKKSGDTTQALNSQHKDTTPKDKPM